MAVVIRLRRTGRKNRPCFRITVTDSRFPRDGRSLETLGLYDPLRKDPAQQLTLDQERAKHWLEHGAVPSEIIQSMFNRLGVFPRKPKVKIERPGRKKKTATQKRRADAQAARLAAKAERHAARVKARRLAAKNAPEGAKAEAKGDKKKGEKKK